MIVSRSIPGPGVSREPVFYPIGGQPTDQHIASKPTLPTPRLPYVKTACPVASLNGAALTLVGKRSLVGRAK